MLIVVCLNARIVLDALIVLNQLGRYAIWQVCWDMIKDAGLQVPNPNEDFEIGDG